MNYVLRGARSVHDILPGPRISGRYGHKLRRSRRLPGNARCDTEIAPQCESKLHLTTPSIAILGAW